MEYRRSLVSSFFFKFYLKISQQLGDGEVRFSYIVKEHFSCLQFRDMVVLTANDRREQESVVVISRVVKFVRLYLGSDSYTGVACIII